MKFMVIFDDFVDDGRELDSFCYYFQVLWADVVDEDEEDFFALLGEDVEDHVLG